ncbi:serine/threonine-protein kinase [Intrasporangium flavum]|uniref:serine/threonine-protein kinase n=1 Tax=Intrasporangium flavum TaxID=1428657 RepID=UPI00096F7663|nr:serine/threonine-protein kinase [Intrasporangium flavum]
MSQERQVVAGRYRLLDRIGAGGMGQVWLAWDERLSRAVALKLLHPPVGLPRDDAAVTRERAMREARITARLHHPNAVPVYDVVDHEGSPSLVMQYLPSRSLHEVLTTDGTLDPREAARIGAGIASALAAAHEAGIVHRDVKPGNILLTTTGTPLLTDFGISRGSGDASLTATGLLTGTPAYLAPEVARGGDSTPSADVFALGATLYAAVEGAPPFGADDNPMALLHRVASGRIDPPRRAGALLPVLDRMLSTDPEARPRMAEAATALAAVAAGGPTTPRAGVAAGAGAQGSAGGHTAVLPVTPDASDASGDASAQPGDEPAVEPTDEPTQEAAGPAEPAPPRIDGATPAPTPAASTAPAPAPFPVAAPAPTSVQAPAPDHEPDRRRTLLLLAAGALLVVLVVGIVLATRQTPPTADAPARQPSSSAGTASTPPRTSPTTGRPSTFSAPSPTTPSPTPSSTPTPTREPATTAPSGAPTDSELAGAVRDYYALLPGDTDAGWDLLTPRYRASTSGSRSSYARFWSAIDRVRVSNVEGTAPSSVVATLRYDYRDGRTYVERTAYTLVQEGGRLKIDRTSVLSSRQL